MKFSSVWPMTALFVVFAPSYSRGDPIFEIFKNNHHHHHHHYSPYPPPPPPPPPLIPVFANPTPQVPIYQPLHVKPVHKPLYVPVNQQHPEYYYKEQYNPSIQPVYQHHHQPTVYNQVNSAPYPHLPVELHHQYQPTVHGQVDSIPSAHLPVEHKEIQRPPVFVPGETNVDTPGNLSPLFFGEVSSALATTENPAHSLGSVPPIASFTETPLAPLVAPSHSLGGIEIPILITIQTADDREPIAFNNEDPIFAPTHNLGVANPFLIPIQEADDRGPIPFNNEAPIIAPTHNLNVADPVFTAFEAPLHASDNGGSFVFPTEVSPIHSLDIADPVFTGFDAPLDASSNGGSFVFPT